MSQKKLNRQDRLSILVELCRQNDVTPNKNIFAGFIIKICVTNLGLTRTQAKNYLKDLNISWKADRWKTLAGEVETDFCVEELMNKEEPLPEVTTIESKSEVFRSKTLDVLKNLGSSEPIHKIDHPVSQQPDGKTERQLAQTLNRIAHENTSGGVGRILLFEAREIADNKKLSMQDLTALWMKYYPTIEFNQATGNVLLIYWDGKNSFRYHSGPIIPPKPPEFKHDSKEGDINEGLDASDELPEESDEGVMTL